jgi:hypothetical protein
MPLNQDKVRAALERAGRSLITDLQASMAASGANATGKTSRSLAYSITFSPNAVQFLLTGGTGWAFVEQGRGPTKRDGNGEVFRAIKEWAAARGIPESRVPGIVKTIHEKGTRLHRLGIRRDIYTKIITDKRIALITEGVGIIAERETASDIVQAFKP